MKDNNKNQQNEVTNYVDPRTVQAEVIGELRKDKIGKPILVIEMMLLFLIVIIALPFVTSMLNDENSALYKIIYGSTGTVTPTIDNPQNEFLDGTVEQSLAMGMTMKAGNIIMKDFSLAGDQVNCKIYSYNGILNLDEEEYYLEIYSASKNLLAAIKLTGTYDNFEKEVSLTSYGLSFNNKYSYVGKIVNMKEKSYPEINLETDESGIGSIVCKLENRSIEYVFQNGYLIEIRDEQRVSISEGATEYLNRKREYDDKAAKLGSIATVTENSEGFIFNANMNLESYTIPSTVIDYNYYALDTEASEITYAETGKGFDCK